MNESRFMTGLASECTAISRPGNENLQGGLWCASIISGTIMKSMQP